MVEQNKGLDRAKCVILKDFLSKTLDCSRLYNRCRFKAIPLLIATLLKHYKSLMKYVLIILLGHYMFYVCFSVESRRRNHSNERSLLRRRQ